MSLKALLPKALGARLPGGTRVWLISALLGSALIPLPLAGQGEGDCDVPDHRGFSVRTQSNDSRIIYYSYPTFRCPDGFWINADSAVVFEGTNYSQLFGNVVFRDPETRLTADEARYFSQTGRLTAWGRAELTDQVEGSVFQGDTITLERAGEGRDEDRLTVTGSRPHATLYPTPQPPPPPEEAEEDTLPVAGEDTLSAAAQDTVLPGDTLGLPPDSAAPPPVEEVEPVEVAEPHTAPPGLPVEEEDRTPYEIDAGRFLMEGRRYFRASGGVLVQRDSLDAVADSLVYDQEAGALSLLGEAGLKTAEFDLAGESILMELPGDEIRQVLATGQALLEGESLRLLAPAIAVTLEEGRLERLVAMASFTDPDASLEDEEQAQEPSDEMDEELPEGRLGRVLEELGLEAFPTRPYSVAQDFLLEADSMEVFAPGEVLEEVWAMGSARGETLSRDSLNTPETPQFMLKDWLEGDTIIATFSAKGAATSDEEAGPPELEELVDPEAIQGVPMPTPSDSAGPRNSLERLVARVAARSFYRLAASDSTVAEEGGRLAVHYVVGSQITIFMSGGEVDRMEVTGATVGVHAEPVAQVAREGAPPDTTGVAPDTSGVAPDTSGVAPDTSGVAPDTSIVLGEPPLGRTSRRSGGRFPILGPREEGSGR